jgi:hypothetical protein
MVSIADELVWGGIAGTCIERLSVSRGNAAMSTIASRLLESLNGVVRGLIEMIRSVQRGVDGSGKRKGDARRLAESNEKHGHGAAVRRDMFSQVWRESAAVRGKRLMKID